MFLYKMYLLLYFLTLLIIAIYRYVEFSKQSTEKEEYVAEHVKHDIITIMRKHKYSESFLQDQITNYDKKPFKLCLTMEQLIKDDDVNYNNQLIDYINRHNITIDEKGYYCIPMNNMEILKIFWWGSSN